MKTIAIIPARLNSERLPNKPLLKVAGKPIIQHVWDNLLSPLLDNKIVATDSEDIFKTVIDFGGKAIMTNPNCSNGTERCAEVAKKFEDYDLVVNVQGDEPMVNNKIIEKLVNPFLHNPKLVFSTLKTEIGEEEANNPHVVKVVSDKNGFALYFSRSKIPFVRETNKDLKYFKHLGFYAFKREFLLDYVKQAPTFLEKMEKLEQLRILENGEKIFVADCHEKLIDINTPEDLEKFKKYFS